MKIKIIPHPIPARVIATSTIKYFAVSAMFCLISLFSVIGVIYNEYSSMIIMIGAVFLFATVGFTTFFLITFINQITEYWAREARVRASKFEFDDEERKAIADVARPLLDAMVNAANNGKLKTLEEYEKKKETEEVEIHYILEDCVTKKEGQFLTGWSSVVVNKFIVLIRHFEDVLASELKEAFKNVSLILSSPGVEYKKFLFDSKQTE